MILLILLSSIPLVGTNANQSKAFDENAVENVLPTTTDLPTGDTTEPDNNGSGE